MSRGSPAPKTKPAGLAGKAGAKRHAGAFVGASVAIWGIFAFLAPMFGAAELIFSAIPPPARVAPGKPAYVTILAANPSMVQCPFAPREMLWGRLSAGARTWNVRFDGEPSRVVAIGIGEFCAWEYRFLVPDDVVGPARVDIALDDTHVLQTVVEVAGPPPPGVAR